MSTLGNLEKNDKRFKEFTKTSACVRVHTCRGMLSCVRDMGDGVEKISGGLYY